MRERDTRLIGEVAVLINQSTNKEVRALPCILCNMKKFILTVGPNMIMTLCSLWPIRTHCSNIKISKATLRRYYRIRSFIVIRLLWINCLVRSMKQCNDLSLEGWAHIAHPWDLPSTSQVTRNDRDIFFWCPRCLLSTETFVVSAHELASASSIWKNWFESPEDWRAIS